MRKHIYVLAVLALIGFGCSRNSKAPEPLALTEVGPTLEREFASAKPEVATTVSNIVYFVKEKNYVEAIQYTDDLSKNASLSSKQRSIVVRAHLALVDSVKVAAESGDEKAENEMNYRRATK